MSSRKYPGTATVHFIFDKYSVFKPPAEYNDVVAPPSAQISGSQCSVILPFLLPLLLPRLEIQVIPVVELLALFLRLINTLIRKSPDSNILCRLPMVILVPSIN